MTDLTMTFPAGTMIGNRYEIEKVLGSGGMATVYLANDPKYKDFKVALKVFHPGIIRSAEARDRFRTEVNAAYRVPHQNVVQVYEFFDENSLFAFAMEYSNGGDLHSRMRRGPLTVRQIIEVLYQAASGITAIHEQGVVHRDLKPENIMLTTEGLVKVSDFGVARLPGASTPTQMGHIVGTPRYVSPEYVSTGDCDARADIFSLGFIGFEILAGKGPYPEDKNEILSRSRFAPENRRYLSDFSIEYPEELEMIIEKCLMVDLGERYQTAQELCDDLANLKEGRSLSAETARTFKDTYWKRGVASLEYALSKYIERIHTINVTLTVILLLILAIQYSL